jgi:phosphoglycerate dehydrogenase-like enzyme
MSRIIISLLLSLALCGSAIAQDEWSTEEFLSMTGVREGAVPSRELSGWQPDPVIVMRGDGGDGYPEEFPGAEFVMVNTRDELLAAAPRANVIIGFCDGDAIAAASGLVWVQIFSSGVDRCLVVDELASGKILLTNMQKMSSPTIGEHAVAMALSLARGLVQYGRAMPDGQWRRDLASGPGMYSVSGKTLLVVGLGGIGSAAAKRAKALGMRVIATRNSSREGPAWVDYVGLSDELETLLAEADIVINALPLTDSTRGLFDRHHFDLMKRGAHFINVGRGGTVITDDLVAALESGQLAGAGLDVTDPEPLPAEHPLWQMPNVIITPHVSGFGSDRRLHATLLRENLRRYLAGERLLNVVDPERGY